MQHTTRTRLAGVIVTGGLVMAAFAAPSAALASKPIPTHQVTICHATDSDTNPYVMITVDVASTGELERGHTGHTGPVWNPTLKADHVKWGDIIPAYTYGEYTFPGQNLEDGGQEILDADCAIPAEEAQDADESTDPATETEQPTEQPTEQVEELGTEDPSQPVEEEASADATDPAGSEQPTETEQPAGTEQPTGEGEIVYDGGFVTPTPASTPVGAVLGATGRPDMTPPATDTLADGAGTATGSGIQAILLVLAGLSTLVLVLGRKPAARR